MIVVVHLAKRYGDKMAVNDLSLTVNPGVVTRFLGPSGAGKSMTLRMIVGPDRPVAGTATVNGLAYNHLLTLATTTGIPRRRIVEVRDLVGLAAVGRKADGAFSLGMGQRLGIAAALLGDPDDVIPDEPVNKLDPAGILWIRGLLRSLADEGCTVFISSHLISEIALVADHLVVIGRGELIADTSVSELQQAASGVVVPVRSPRAHDLARLLGSQRAAGSPGHRRLPGRDRGPRRGDRCTPAARRGFHGGDVRAAARGAGASWGLCSPTAGHRRSCRTCRTCRPTPEPPSPQSSQPTVCWPQVPAPPSWWRGSSACSAGQRSCSGVGTPEAADDGRVRVR